MPRHILEHELDQAWKLNVHWQKIATDADQRQKNDAKYWRKRSPMVNAYQQIQRLVHAYKLSTEVTAEDTVAAIGECISHAEKLLRDSDDHK